MCCKRTDIEWLLFSAMYEVEITRNRTDMELTAIRACTK